MLLVDASPGETSPPFAPYRRWRAEWVGPVESAQHGVMVMRRRLGWHAATVQMRKPAMLMGTESPTKYLRSRTKLVGIRNESRRFVHQLSAKIPAVTSYAHKEKCLWPCYGLSVQVLHSARTCRNGDFRDVPGRFRTLS